MISSGAIDIGGDLLNFESLSIADENGDFIEIDTSEEDDDSNDSSDEVEASSADTTNYL
jgi:hypothetical protein